MFRWATANSGQQTSVHAISWLGTKISLEYVRYHTDACFRNCLAWVFTFETTVLRFMKSLVS